MLVDPSMDRAALYVGLSRGMQSNVAYVAVEGDRERLDRLSAMLERDDVERTAVQVQADEFEAADHLGRLGPQWTDLVVMDASERYRTVLHDALGRSEGGASMRTPRAVRCTGWCGAQNSTARTPRSC